MSAPTWQKIAYGTMVAGALATSGTLVWWDTRRQVKAVDFIEVYQGALERCLATQTVQGSNVVISVTNDVVEYADLTNTYFVYDGNNRTETNYWTISGTNAVVSSETNKVGYSYLADPADDPNLEYEYVDEWIVGRRLVSESPFEEENVYATNVVPQAIPMYLKNSRYPWPEDRGTPDILQLVSRAIYLIKNLAPPFYEGPYVDDTLATDGKFDGLTNRPLPMVTWSNVFENAGITNGVTFPDMAGGIITNQIIESTNLGWRYSVLEQMRWTHRAAGLDWPESTTNTTGKKLGTINLEGPNWLDPPGSDVVYKFGFGTSTNSWSEAKSRAADQWATNSFTNGGSAFGMTYCLSASTNYWDARMYTGRRKLVVPNISTNLEPTIYFYVRASTNDWPRTNYVFDSQGLGYSEGEYTLVDTIAGTVPSVTSVWVGSLSAPTWCAGNTGASRGYNFANDPTPRKQVIQEWTPDTNANYLFWEYDASRETWQATKDKCERSLITAAVVTNERPKMGTWGTSALGGAIRNVRAEIKFAPLRVTGVNTQIENDVDFYAYFRPFVMVTETNNTFDGNGFAPSTNWYCFSTEPMATSTVISTNAIGSTDFPVWCDEPSGSGQDAESKGFRVIDEETVLKWDFEYCDEVLP